MTQVQVFSFLSSTCGLSRSCKCPEVLESRHSLGTILKNPFLSRRHVIPLPSLPSSYKRRRSKLARVSWFFPEHSSPSMRGFLACRIFPFCSHGQYHGYSRSTVSAATSTSRTIIYFLSFQARRSWILIPTSVMMRNSVLVVKPLSCNTKWSWNVPQISLKRTREKSRMTTRMRLFSRLSLLLLLLLLLLLFFIIIVIIIVIITIHITILQYYYNIITIINNNIITILLNNTIKLHG